MNIQNSTNSMSLSNEKLKKIIQKKLNTLNLELLKKCESQDTDTNEIRKKIFQEKKVLNEIKKTPKNVLLELIITELSSSIIDVKNSEVSENFYHKSI